MQVPQPEISLTLPRWPSCVSTFGVVVRRSFAGWLSAYRYQSVVLAGSTAADRLRDRLLGDIRGGRPHPGSQGGHDPEAPGPGDRRGEGRVQDRGEPVREHKALASWSPRSSSLSPTAWSRRRSPSAKLDVLPRPTSRLALALLHRALRHGQQEDGTQPGRRASSSSRTASSSSPRL